MSTSRHKAAGSGEPEVLSERIRELEDAFKQAYELAEECQTYVGRYPREKYNIDSDLLVMRANHERLLK